MSALVHFSVLLLSHNPNHSFLMMKVLRLIVYNIDRTYATNIYETVVGLSTKVRCVFVDGV